MEHQRGNSSSLSVPFTFEHSKNLGNKILKPIRQEKIVKVPVTQYVEKIIEKEEIKYVNKYVDVIKPIITYKTKHISKPIYLDKIKYEPKLIEKEKIIHIPKIEYRNKVVEIPVYVHKENIIEKKVPLIIERVIPVLKVKKIEKEVLTDTVEIPEICEITKDGTNAKIKENIYYEQQREEEIPGKVSIRSNAYVAGVESVVSAASVANVLNVEDEACITKEYKDAYNKETYRNMESTDESPVICSSKHVPHSSVGKFKNQNVNRSSPSNASSNEDSYTEKLEHKNETTYNDATNESAHYGTMPDDSPLMIDEENTSKNYDQKSMEEENYYDINEHYKNSNINHVSINLPKTKDQFQESFEQQYVNFCDKKYNFASDNIIHNNLPIINYDTSNNRYIEDNMNELINEQFMRESSKDTLRHISKTAEDKNRQILCTKLKDHIDIDQKKTSLPSNMHISYENYSSSQNAYSQRSVTGKSNFMPSYANSNGQAFVSVRPATILEYVPKQRKYKSSFCNLMKNCCGGSSDC
ncbi:inner membrane complex protein 1i, putative [Plasmodium malariae]|uniref:Inner membrane complex protein 1i, putative n=1 Tax=Plasmodium malariae TaxID=5858 RepID=A0A1A8VTW5_PLAMA|nr:inner membrane complex protein 1i, putative [Plasmodium malariae]SBS82790.1 inner membrane complex protein 1i, putative (IMC1i) [Plasmodium malariae]SBT87362.1 inner membrane complex protein 1i, putative [Plasmodium malariae]